MTNLTQEIKNIELSDCCTAGTTVAITAVSVSGSEQETFHVQTVDGIFRGDLGCFVLAGDEDGDIDFDDYPAFDLSDVIEKAEAYIQSLRNEEATDYVIDGETAYLINSINGVDVAALNRDYINKETSSYQQEFREPVATFEDRKSALEYLKNLND